MNDKEHPRNLRRLAKAIEASNEMLRKAGIQVRGAEQHFHVPEQKLEIRPRPTKQSLTIPKVQINDVTPLFRAT